jgi:putative endonuclease
LKPDRPWFVYLLLCRGDRLYVGVTTQLAVRMRKHRSGTGAKFTRSYPPERLLAAKCFPSKGAALSMEHQVKQLSAAQKRALASVWAEESPIDDLPVILAVLSPD